jgi:hypothetical protein
MRRMGWKGSWKSLNHSQVLEYSKSSEAVVRLDSRVAAHGLMGRRSIGTHMGKYGQNTVSKGGLAMGSRIPKVRCTS